MYENENEINVCSKFHKPDYGIMHFVCLEKTSRSFSVLTGFSEYKYISGAHAHQFKTWDKYILESFGVTRKAAREQPLRFLNALTRLDAIATRSKNLSIFGFLRLFLLEYRAS
jgi:hypothetical protein